MKKYVILIILLLLLTGCANIYNQDYDSIINDTLSSSKVKKNINLKGYKFYLPEGMNLIGDYEHNNILYSYGDKYYMYADLVSYYNKKQNKYEFDESKYEYLKEFNNAKGNGYVIISKSKGGKLVEVMYNYAKIEVVTNDTKKAIANSLLVLKSIEYNYKTIDSMIGSNALVYDSEQFTLLGPSKNTENFLTYEEEYGVYDESKQNQDEDVIDMESAD